ncbi:MAG: hypothetical protein U5K31_02940 [Balneolaceae bacterium]|nr:hypothetical protein [Balneolaceae bacterium]
MIIDLREDEVPELETYDVCIVGAGAAGITLAREFAGGNLRIALVESGSFTQEQQVQQLYEGEAQGEIPGADSYLNTSRLRYFGGTTNHWGGWCRPLDAIDFEEKAWMPYSGWPISRDDLNPYYRRAEEVVEINSFEPLDQLQYTWSDQHRRNTTFARPSSRRVLPPSSARSIDLRSSTPGILTSFFTPISPISG